MEEALDWTLLELALHVGKMHTQAQPPFFFGLIS